MNRSTQLILGACTAALLSMTAIAQPAPAVAPAGGPASGPRPADCSRAPADQKALCEAHNKGVAACGKERTPEAFHECMDDHMPAPDCSKTPFPDQCKAAQQAREACKSKKGQDRMKCMQEKMPHPKTGADFKPADCSKVPAEGKSMCEAHNKALQACTKSADPQSHNDCMDDHMPGPDCSKAPPQAKEMCQAALKARESCKSQKGPARMKCMHEKMGGHGMGPQGMGPHGMGGPQGMGPHGMGGRGMGGPGAGGMPPPATK